MNTILVIGGGASAIAAAREVQRQGGRPILLRIHAGDWPPAPFPDGIETVDDVILLSLSGRPGRFVAQVMSGGREVRLECGAVVLAVDEIPRSIAPSKGVMSLSNALEDVPSAAERIAIVLNSPHPSRSSHADAVKLASKLKRSRPQREITVFFEDLRTMGLDELHYLDAQKEGVVFIRTASALGIDTKKMIVRAVDAPSGVNTEIMPDLIVVEDEQEIDASTAGRGLLVPTVDHGHLRQGNVSMGTASTLREGVFLCGTAGRPLLTEELITAAKAAATMAVTASASTAEHGKAAKVDGDKCSTCLTCVRTCPYSAPRMGKEKAEVDEDLCQACGVCVSMCPSQAISMEGANRQDLDMLLEKALREVAG